MKELSKTRTRKMNVHKVLHGLFALHRDSQDASNGAVRSIRTDQVFALHFNSLVRTVRRGALCSHSDVLWSEEALLDAVALQEGEQRPFLTGGLVCFLSQDSLEFILGQVGNITRRTLPKQTVGTLKLIDTMQFRPRQCVAIREVSVLKEGRVRGYSR